MGSDNPSRSASLANASPTCAADRHPESAGTRRVPSSAARMRPVRTHSRTQLRAVSRQRILVGCHWLRQCSSKWTLNLRRTGIASGTRYPRVVARYLAGASILAAVLLMPLTAPAAEPVPDNLAEIQPFLEKYCADCHNAESAEGGLNVRDYPDVAALLRDRRAWERVYDRLRVNAMPPDDAEQPPAEERQRVVDWLSHTLFTLDCSAPVDPPPVTIRRLNRVEYNNTIRDLIGVDFRPAQDFPSDDVGYGFDNIGDVLTVPPLLIEKYLAAAEQITAAALMTEDEYRVRKTVRASQLDQEGGVEDGPRDTKGLYSRGSVSTRFRVRVAGEYVIRVAAAADQAGDEPARMELRLGDDSFANFDVTGDRRPVVYERTLQLEPGRKTVSATFINDFYNEAEQADRNLYVGSIAMEGPLSTPQMPDTHTRLIGVYPSDTLTPEAAAIQNLSSFLPRAFRRTVTEDEIAPYASFVSAAIEHGDTFERGMETAIQAALVSPQFLFRVETDKRDGSPDQHQWLTDDELASRLSYFLWSSMPDDELRRVAAEQDLHDDSVLTAQIVRMLADPKAGTLVENFAGQWLNLRRLSSGDVTPDPDVFPDLGTQILGDMRHESELFLASIFSDDRPLTDLLTARHTFVNRRLARFYGLENVEFKEKDKEDEFVRVELTGDRRIGILTQPAILTLTSFPTRTSPVKRGQWVLENLLGDRPPDPPPGVPALDATREANPNLTVRQQLELHRANPTCASCHKLMDDIGFGLENFDAIGRWRDQDGSGPIDASGTLPSGESFRGPVELVTILSGRERDFVSCVAEKLLTYALGRGLEYHDQCAVTAIVDRTTANGNRFSALVTSIVLSDIFRLARPASVASRETAEEESQIAN